MNQQIVDYLTENRAAHPQEALVKQLTEAGHAPGQIRDAITSVYGESASSLSQETATPKKRDAEY